MCLLDAGITVLALLFILGKCPLEQIDRYDVAAFVLLGYGAFMFASLVGLYGYHLNLIALNQTTNERVKGVYLGVENPHDQGCCANYYLLCCVEVPPPSRLKNMWERVSVDELPTQVDGGAAA